MRDMPTNQAPLPSAEAAEPPLLRVRGQLDRENFVQLIAQASHSYTEGARRLRIDLAESPVIGVAGLFGLFAVAELFDGRTPPDGSDGWGAIHSMFEADGRPGAPHPVELVGLRPGATQALDRAGLLCRFGVLSPGRALGAGQLAA